MVNKEQESGQWLESRGGALTGIPESGHDKAKIQDLFFIKASFTKLHNCNFISCIMS